MLEAEMRAVPLALLLATGCVAMDDDPVAVLMRLRDQVVQHGQRIPNHTCVETVERSRYKGTRESLKSCDAILARRKQPGYLRQLRLSTTDRLRLDVGFAGDREIYSWPGAGRFEEGEIDELVPDGAMGTGAYASLLMSVSSDRISRFVFAGDTALKGRTLFEYSYRVATDDSRYRYKSQTQWVNTGYTGTLLVDPRTAELVRFTVRTDELPPGMASCEVDTSMEYAKVRLSGDDFLLPSSTRQRFIGRDGSEDENTYTFSSCRDFQARSTIVTGENRGSSGGVQAARSAAPPPWPAGLPVSIDLATAIDSDTAAAGDRIEGRLAEPVHGESSGTLAPRAALVMGRLMRVAVRHTSPPQVTIALRWERVEFDGLTVPLSLTPNRQAKSGMQFGGLAALVLLLRKRTESELPLPGEEQYGVFHLPGEHRVVDKGLRSEWFTSKP